MRVLVVDETAERAELLRAALTLAGHEVTASLSLPLALLKTIERLQPDVIVIDTDSPSRDVLEHLVMISQHTPRPVVMFTSDGSPEAIRAAARAGVAAYVVDGMDENRINTIIDVAVARFENYEKLRVELAGRKDVERAKGLLMAREGLSEEDAFKRLRKASQLSGKPLKVVAEALIALDA